MPTLNLGILAHVDAGKTSLTERLLFAAGVIGEIGSVDRGSTQTDTLALERQRGITIKSAVAAFTIGDVAVSLIDTPGHPDFIAEVERVLSVLDGAVLVISAVEGVQAQTRVLMRTLQRLRIPTLIFVNKIDRGGARYDEVLREISGRLTPSVIAMGTVADLGARHASCSAFSQVDAGFAESLADLLAARSDALLAAYVTDEASVSYAALRSELAAQTSKCLVHPVFFGSAITGAGTAALSAGIAELLPAAAGEAGGPLSGAVFKVERGRSGEKIAYARIFSGTLHTRDKIPLGSGREGRVTAISVHGSARPRPRVTAGQIARLRGLADVQTGDAIGSRQADGAGQYFAPPTLETVVVPARPADSGALQSALTMLAEQDPLINLRQDDERRELLVSLYGEVQKEVIQATLADDFGLAVSFRDTTVICTERLAGAGRAVEHLGDPANPFLATVGLRVEPAAAGSGTAFRLAVDIRSVPMYVYKTEDEFAAMMTRYVRDTLQQGLRGWQVTDCAVTMHDCGYSSPATQAADYRKLTPLVLMSALQQAGTRVCEPVSGFRLEVPADCVPAVLTAVARLGGTPQGPQQRDSASVIEGEIPAGRVHDLQVQLSSLTRGEGMLESQFARYRPVRGAAPGRRRTDNNPLNRREYLLAVQRGVRSAGLRG